MMIRGVRGAITATANTREAILDATEQVLRELVKLNEIHIDHIASIFFTTSPDLNACYPAEAARKMGWQYTALLGAQEMDYPSGIKQCIRVLIHWNTDKTPQEIQHAYLGEAAHLRPEFARKSAANGAS